MLSLISQPKKQTANWQDLKKGDAHPYDLPVSAVSVSSVWLANLTMSSTSIFPSDAGKHAQMRHPVHIRCLNNHIEYTIK